MDVSVELVAAIGTAIVGPLVASVGLLLKQRGELAREAIIAKAREGAESIAERDRMRVACEAEKEVLRRAHAAEMGARIEDAKGYAASMLKIHEVVIVAVGDSKASDARVVAEIAENTRVTREHSERLERLAKSGVLPPRGGSRP